jgi:hypothetical protein
MMNAGKKSLLLLSAAFVVATPALQGCTPIEAALGLGGYAIYKSEFEDVDINLTEKNYAAADYITQQMRGNITKYDLIRAKPLTAMENPQLTSALARIVPLQVGSRLAQLGYRMDMSEVVSPQDEGLYSSADTAQAPDFLLTGTYRMGKDSVLVNLRILNAKDKRVIGAFEYHVPESREIKKLAQPEPQIYIIEKQPSVQ